ncbi:hypothetical protein AALP_AA6G345000 [Arabis alpina]|uniref:pectinesterase n=1 Tax=Arabis alpina TaxID=50452 RepID=A0A087GTK8_ARAAL|nr:hypothetical protein AALP_AA6G345000 [Arabis alpina]
MGTHGILIGLIALCCFCLPHFIEAKPYHEHVFVDQSGHGNFTTIQKAIDSVPNNNRYWFFINVKAGLYREKIIIPREKPFIVIIGAGQSLTRVEWDDHEKLNESITFATHADNTVVKSITFVNSYNLPSNGKTNKNPKKAAAAAFIGGDKSAFYSVGFVGIQDTLWDNNGRHYFSRCTIQGSVDFICGAGQSIYQSCEIQVVGRPGLASYITAQARNHSDEANGFVFINSLVYGTGMAFLGRAWRNYSRVIFYNSNLTNVVIPEGWDSWNARGHENQLTYAEYGCFGSGSNIGRRVKWVNKLNISAIQSFADLKFINRGGWFEKLPIPV